jgi:hypothetical protein
LENGDPLMAVYVPEVGSNHRAVLDAASFAILTEIVVCEGRYATPNLPSGVTAEVTYDESLMLPVVAYGP